MAINNLNIFCLFDIIVLLDFILLWKKYSYMAKHKEKPSNYFLFNNICHNKVLCYKLKDFLNRI